MIFVAMLERYATQSEKFSIDRQPGFIWAMSWENLLMPYASNKGADQPAHQHSLISAFVVHCLDSTIPPFSIYEISSLQLVAVAAQAGLSLPCSQTPKTGFLVTRLILETGNIRGNKAYKLFYQAFH